MIPRLKGEVYYLLLKFNFRFKLKPIFTFRDEEIVK